ncbi:MAG: hypothetical protein JNJ77_07570 [Planctomycetia bacterium]|nr:hypothetical protein [Planctomycetia bacterium]
MGMDLTGPAGYFRWDFFRWHRLLSVAERYGWEPAGTVIAEEEAQQSDWNGSYWSNDFQTVTAADAEQLGAALERALSDISDADELAHHRGADGSLRLTRSIIMEDDIKWLSGPDCKNHIREFIQYCRGGGFTIG